nr:hypothetical protein CFP56_50835 [Quercus suber]
MSSKYIHNALQYLGGRQQHACLWSVRVVVTGTADNPDIDVDALRPLLVSILLQVGRLFLLETRNIDPRQDSNQMPGIIPKSQPRFGLLEQSWAY